FATRFQDLVEGFDFPTRSVPLEFFNRLKRRRHRQIRNEFPIDCITSRGSLALLRMDHSQQQLGILPLLSNWRQDADASVSEFQNSVSRATFIVLNCDAM